MNCRTTTRTKYGNRPIIWMFAIIKTGSRKINPIKKFKRLLITDAIGMISRGNIPCFNMEELLIKELVASIEDEEKNIHGIIPAKTNKV